MSSSTWDVRAVSLLSEADGRALLERLRSPELPVLVAGLLTRSGPAEWRPWFGALHLVRVPIHLRRRGASASGYVDVMDVGAGSTEVRLCLTGTSRRQRLLGRRRLHDAAHTALGLLVSREAARGTRRSFASGLPRTARPAPNRAPGVQA